MELRQNLKDILVDLQPVLNDGEYVFVSVEESVKISSEKVIGSFKEKEGTTLILNKKEADTLQLPYYFISAWLTLEVNSSLQAIGLTAVFATALAQENISCNVIAGYHHDHIFVDVRQALKALKVLRELSTGC